MEQNSIMDLNSMTQIEAAKKYPRNYDLGLQKIINTVKSSQKFAKSCKYILPRGGKDIQGPSVHLAKFIAQTLGNFRMKAEVVEITKNEVVSQATVTDLENNNAVQISVRRSIMTSKGRMTNDMITVTGNAANSISLRNAIFALVPKFIIDSALEQADKTMVGGSEPLIDKVDKALKYFKKEYNIEEDFIIKRLRRSKKENIEITDLTKLYGWDQSIKDGDTSAESLFRTSSAINEAYDVNKKSDLEKFIEKANSKHALLVIEAQCKTEAEKKAYKAKFEELNNL